MNDIFKIFRVAADKEKATAMSAYMKNNFKFIGIQSPKRRELTKSFLKTIDKTAVDWSFVFKCWEQPEREFQYFALDYLEKFKKSLAPSDISKLRKIAETKSWWDSIDWICHFVGEIALTHPKVNETILKWSIDKNFWIRRIAIIHQLQRKDKTNTALLEQVITNNFGSNEFFINKAIGWALREYSKTNPKWVKSFISKHKSKMNLLSIREASKFL